jgi:hypothetical protein
MNVEFTNFERQVFLNTVRIENLTDKETGTGFLVGKKAENGSSRILLFSNKHVFWGKKDINTKNVSKMVRITLHKKGKNGEFLLGEKIEITGTLYRDRDKGYYDHPDENVDIGCANISKLANDDLGPYIALLGDDFFDFEVKQLHPGSAVKFVGYPNGFFDTVNNLPILRSGTIASIPDINFMGKPQILIDAQVFPGSSGSPVFVSFDGKYKLIGVLSSAVFKALDFHKREISEEENSVPIEWLGLGILFTTDTLREVYEIAL